MGLDLEPWSKVYDLVRRRLAELDAEVRTDGCPTLSLLRVLVWGPSLPELRMYLL
ncbi:MAG: hypothetical protein ACT4OP_02460 [Actinomycetota bacterium]